MKTPYIFKTLTSVLIFMLTFSVNAMQTDEKKENTYYFSTTVNGTLEEVTAKVKTTLKAHGFGVITELDMHEKLNSALDKDLKPYRLLGVCDPSSAFEALQKEENIGLMLPCKMLIREIDANTFSVVSVDPMLMLNLTGNKDLDGIGKDVSERLKKVINEL